jgi:hypothetical protein
LALEKDETAGPALLRMGEILSAKNPYSLVKLAEGLITTVGGVNQQLLLAARTQANATIQNHQEKLAKDIDAAQIGQADQERLKKPLKDLHMQIGQEQSLAHIIQAENESERLFDAALKKLALLTAPKIDVSGGTGDVGGVVVPPPLVKERHVIKPSEIKKDYIETTEQMEVFLAELRQQIQQALDKKQRIEIR